MPDAHKEVTDANFAEVVMNSKKPVLVDFWAQWCNPCQLMKPVVEKVANTHADKYTVATVEVDHNPKTAEHFNVMSIPTFIVVDNGNVKAQFNGVMTEKNLVERIESALKS